MTTDEAGAYYEEAVCIANTFGEVRRAEFALAQDDRVNVDVLRETAPLDAERVREAATALQNPPRPWPDDVAQHVARRALNLLDKAVVLESIWAVTDADEFLEWWELASAEERESNTLTNQIRDMLSLPSKTECAETRDPAVLGALAQLAQPQPMTVSIDCYAKGSSEDRIFTSLTELYNAIATGWKVDFCSVEATDIDVATLPDAQRKAIRLLRSTSDEGPLDGPEAFVDLTGNCANDPSDGFGDMNTASATLMFCPANPKANIIKEFAAGSRIVNDGDHIVGEEISAGTWKSAAPVSDCYWERTTPNGARIANDFITFASSGAIVTVQSSDGSFTTEGCERWRRIA